MTKSSCSALITQQRAVTTRTMQSQILHHLCVCLCESSELCVSGVKLQTARLTFAPSASVSKEERAVFDIHDYGDRIVGALSGVGHRRSFASIVAGLDNFEACKYMLASLQLVNNTTPV